MSGDLQSLIEAAKEAREYSVAPFSGFRVGAAVKTDSGKVYTGCNVESSSYGLTVCAERVAIWKALSEGERNFTELAVVAFSDGRAILRETGPGVSVAEIVAATEAELVVPNDVREMPH